MTASNQQLYQRVKAQFERYVGTDDCLDLAPVREVTDEIEWLTRERNQAVKTSQEIREDFLDLMRVIQRYQPPGSPPPGGGVAVAKWVLETLSTRPAVEIERLTAVCNKSFEATMRWENIAERYRRALERLEKDAMVAHINWRPHEFRDHVQEITRESLRTAVETTPVQCAWIEVKHGQFTPGCGADRFTTTWRDPLMKFCEYCGKPLQWPADVHTDKTTDERNVSK